MSTVINTPSAITKTKTQCYTDFVEGKGGIVYV